jgi:glycosyltransferase involved in cell wall biosynthesis
MLSTIHAGHARHSGYGLLANYIPGAEFLHAPRADPKGDASLFFARVARRAAFSRWYLGGSASIEWQAFRHLRSGFDGIVHSMWADHDLGYLDLFVPNKSHRFVGTFHNCPDDFQHTIRFPSRLKSFAGVILMSECQREFFRAAGVEDNRIHVVLHGVDTEYFTPGTRIDDGTFRVLSAGGFRRNFPLLRQVCEKLQRVPDLHIDVIAPAAFRDLFGGLPNVEFLTGIDDETLLAKYRRASCLLHTAENATANNVLLEGLACGVPIVAERVGGIPEYVTPECSVLTEPRNADALADALEEVARSSNDRTRMSEAARRRAEELSWPKVAARMIEIYRQL